MQLEVSLLYIQCALLPFIFMPFKSLNIQYASLMRQFGISYSKNALNYEPLHVHTNTSFHSYSKLVTFAFDFSNYLVVLIQDFMWLLCEIYCVFCGSNEWRLSHSKLSFSLSHNHECCSVFGNAWMWISLIGRIQTQNEITVQMNGNQIRHQRWLRFSDAIKA